MHMQYKTTGVVSSVLLSVLLAGCGAGASDETASSGNRYLKTSNVNANANGQDVVLDTSSTTTATTSPTTTTTTTTSPTTTTTTSPTTTTTSGSTTTLAADTTVSTSSITSSQLVGDMSLAHEAYVDGINPAWGWGSAPRMGTGV